MGPKIWFIFALFAPILMLAVGAFPGAITRLPKLIYVAFLVALLCAGVGVFAASAWHGEAAVSTIGASKQGADPDYVEGPAKLGIVYLPARLYAPVLIDARPAK
jgi:hypothetical protein